MGFLGLNLFSPREAPPMTLKRVDMIYGPMQLDEDEINRLVGVLEQRHLDIARELTQFKVGLQKMAKDPNDSEMAVAAYRELQYAIKEMRTANVHAARTCKSLKLKLDSIQEFVGA